MTSAVRSRLTAPAGAAALELRGAALHRAGRVLWEDLDLSVGRGEFVSVLGPNGAGKTTLLRVLLGELPLTAGSATILGAPITRGSTQLGYLPQRGSEFAGAGPAARDLVRSGADGDRWGLPFGSARRAVRDRVDALLAAVGATGYANEPAGVLSGGELQRVRIAQALAGAPAVLLCDEPLAALDLRHQTEVVRLIAERLRAAGGAVLFVTHDITPVMPYTDRVLYLAGGAYRLGPVNEVLTSESLTALYGAPVEVIQAAGRLLVVPSVSTGVPDPTSGVCR